MEFKQSPVIFDEDSHSYQLDGKRLLGITGLIHSILGLGVYPEADDYVKDYIIPKAGSRGTAIHHAIQTYDQLGIKQTVQTVNTRQGDHYEMMEWNVSQELDNYIRHLNGFESLANELTVSDNNKYASQIDNVWRRVDTNGIWLVDTKSNNIDLYPLCGYYQDSYFNSGEQALQEYLSWQLSIYAELFEAENPGLKIEGLACNWLRKDRAAFWVIPRKPSKLVKELLTTDYMFTDNGPVYFHHDLSVFGITNKCSPESAPTTSTESEALAPIISPESIDEFAALLRQHREIEAKLDESKKNLRDIMLANNIKSFDFGPFSAVIVADSETISFDSKKFKSDHAELYSQYTTRKPKKGGFTIKYKEQ